MEEEIAEKTVSAKRRKGYYEPIIKRAKYWPVVQLSKHRKEFIDEVVNATIAKIKAEKSTRKELIEEIETVHYREKIRIRSSTWRVDPADDKEFWDKVKQELVNLPPEAPHNDDVEKILKRIVDRYTSEIAGNFKSNRYRLTRSIVKFGFRRLLNAARVKGLFAIFKSDYNLTDKIQIQGEIDQLRRLAENNTIVMVPTHFSNLDSVLIGWIIHVLGLPPFIYGAGLNLFNIKVFAYFMNSLGAYKVDRRKRNYLYLEALKMYSRRALLKGAHSLFFPGGTRSRSGQIETTLKRGLLSTTLEAQRSMLLNKETANNRIYVVPVVINYNFVLEAPGLITEHLRKAGQERYYKESDEFSTSYRISRFLVEFFTKGSNISVSIGKPMDVLGNFIDDKGDSVDQAGKKVEVADYFTSDGKITVDNQREEEYTRILSKRIVQEYYRSNRVFASHLVAWVAFKYWQNKFPKLDLFAFLRVPEEDLEIQYEVFRKEVESYRDKLVEMEKAGILHVADHLRGDIDDVIKLGLENVGLYHVNRPLLNIKGRIVTKSLNTLYYYHNRLQGYDL